MHDILPKIIYIIYLTTDLWEKKIFEKITLTSKTPDISVYAKGFSV